MCCNINFDSLLEVYLRGDNMRQFHQNISGRVKNFNIPKNQPLLPLFEAIVNSIHALEERKKEEPTFKNGYITIEIERSFQLPMTETNLNVPIDSFYIKDNGIGFNEDNFNSFLEADSMYKANLGGKGVGRFSWLVVFKRATIESTYCENNSYVKRSFDFSTNTSFLDDKLEECCSKDNLTVVKLDNCLKPYYNTMPKLGSTIAIRIIQHCLSYFISKDCPQINLIDNGEKFDLNSIFHEKIKTDSNKVNIKINDDVIFELLHVKAEEASINGNKLFLCANSRLVDTKELEKYIVDLDKTIYQENNFWYIGVLTGKYLDDNVDMNRLSFKIPYNESSEEMINTLSLERILKETCVEIKDYLKNYLLPISKKKDKRIKEYVTEVAPQFRHLLKHKSNEVAAIKPNLSNEKLDDELHRIKRELDKEIKEKNNLLLKELNEGVFNYEEYQELFNKQIEKINDTNGAALAEYVAHRKVVIDLLEYAIRKNNDGKFQKENYIHNLMYPMHTTSKEMSYKYHNLWLIDEKLSYCSYISSDIPFDNDQNQERTDIMILDNPVAISDDKNDGSEFGTIILFELKRPMRDNYSDSDNPITQLYNYADKINSGKAKDKDGRIIRSSKRTKFYLYSVCDVTPTLEKKLRQDGFKKTLDNIGYHKYNEEYNAYIEVLPYDKMINDAKKRNRILFEQLGI